MVNVKNLKLNKRFFKSLKNTACCLVLLTDVLHTQAIIAEDLNYEVYNEVESTEQINLDTEYDLQALIENQYEERVKKESFDDYIESLANVFDITDADVIYVIENNIEELKDESSESFTATLKDEITASLENNEIKSYKEYDQQKVRLTTYQYTPNGSQNSLGGSIGDVSAYIKEGTIYFDNNGFAIWKGGTTSKLNGQVYGEKGKDYLIVATATEYLIGQYGFVKYNEIDYYKYNDTFKLKLTTNNGSQVYDAIVLDSCGASMCYGEGMKGDYAPTSSREIEYSELTKNKKIDIFTAPLEYTNISYPNEIGTQFTEVDKSKVKVKNISQDAYNYVEENYLNK